MRALADCRIAFRSPAGLVVAHVVITAIRDSESSFTAPLIEVGAGEARDHGETTLQLRESERYEYEVIPAGGAVLSTLHLFLSTILASDSMAKIERM